LYARTKRYRAKGMTREMPRGRERGERGERNRDRDGAREE
jgi:hypothetical protein